MTLTAHGVISCAVRQMRGYQVDPFLTYKPGALSLFLGGVYCTSHCAFCMSTDQVWRPETVPWAYGERGIAQSGGWYGRRAMLHPAGAVKLAQAWECSQLEFGINEPLLTYEYTLDTARLAKAAGLDVLIETNGFSTPAAVRELAPYVDAIDLGVKGSGDPAFYERWMRAPGAMPAVMQAARTWQAAGVHVLIGDVIAPPHMQTDEATTEAQKRFYGWIAESLGPHTPLLLTPMMPPGPASDDKPDDFLLAAGAGDGERSQYARRLQSSLDLARAAGLAYAHQKGGEECITCHNCGGVLLQYIPPLWHCRPCPVPKRFCEWWRHEQHVTDGRCDHCGAAVPVVTLSTAELHRAWETARTSCVGDDSPKYEVGTAILLPQATIDEVRARWYPTATGADHDAILAAYEQLRPASGPAQTVFGEQN